MANFKTTSELREYVLNSQSKADLELEKVGKLSARTRMNLLFDEGTFVEVGTYVGRKRTELDIEDDDSLEPIVTGYGAINGQLVFAFSQDYSRLKGALGEMHAKKICKLYDMALKQEAPIIGVFDSAGAKILEGVDALNGYGLIMSKCSEAKLNCIPQIAIVAGPCTGSTAIISQMMDITIISKKNGELRIASSEILSDKTLGTPEKVAEDGLAAILCEDEKECIEKAKKLVSYLEMTIPSNDEINRLVDVEDILSTNNYDSHEIVNQVVDANSFLELYDTNAKMLVCGLATINSRVVGIMINNPSFKEGKLCPGSIDKANRFVSLCTTIGAPIITLVDSIGMPSSDRAETKLFSEKLANYVYNYSTANCTKVTVILGRAYGSLYVVFGSKSVGADVVLALDSAKVSALSPDTAVAFLGIVDDESKHKETAEEWANTYSSSLQAAKSGLVDDIISSVELRQRIAASLEMLEI